MILRILDLLKKLSVFLNNIFESCKCLKSIFNFSSLYLVSLLVVSFLGLNAGPQTQNFILGRELTNEIIFMWEIIKNAYNPECLEGLLIYSTQLNTGSVVRLILKLYQRSNSYNSLACAAFPSNVQC